MIDPKPKAILAGGSGFLGRELATTLNDRGWETVVLTRNPARYRGAGRAIAWDGQTVGAWATELEGAQLLVNLAGKNVNCRPTPANRRAILESRVDSVRVLGKALRSVEVPPTTWIQASSLAIYGDAGDTICDESARVAEEWPANVCTAWEAALGEAALPHQRLVILRIGFVLGRRDGALPFLRTLARWGLGGRIGHGKQWISWLHIADLNRIFLRCLEDESLAGIFHATGPHPLTNAEMMRTIRHDVGGPFEHLSPPAPAWAVRIGAPMIGSDPTIALTGRHCLPGKLSRLGFTFHHPDFAAALRQLNTHP